MVDSEDIRNCKLQSYSTPLISLDLCKISNRLQWIVIYVSIDLGNMHECPT